MRDQLALWLSSCPSHDGVARGDSQRAFPFGETVNLLTSFSDIPQTSPMVRDRLDVSQLPYALMDIKNGLGTIVDRGYRGLCVVKVSAKDVSRLRAKSPHFDSGSIWFRRGNVFLKDKKERAEYMEVLYVLVSLKLEIVSGLPVVKWAHDGVGQNDDPHGDA